MSFLPALGACWIKPSNLAAPYLLQQLSAQPRYAYSLRRLSSAYTGQALRVRRSSDNAEQDIGFTGSGALDTSALTTFVGAGDGFISTWYDQSGNAYHATQSTAASQYRIVDSGVVTTGAHGQPALQNASGDSFFLNVPITGISNGQVNRCIAGVFTKVSTPQTLNRLWAMWDSVSNITGWAAGIDSGNNDIRTFMAINGASFPGTETTGGHLGPTAKTAAYFQLEPSGTDTTLSNKLFGDNTESSSTVAAGADLSSMNLQGSTIGRSSSSTTTFEGDISELIYWENLITGTGDETLYTNSVTEAYFA